MKVKQLRLKGFKRFDDLTIDLGSDPARVVALVGPNGCGKSSVFDAFERRLSEIKSGRNVPESFLSKYLFHRDPELQKQRFELQQSVQLQFADGSAQPTKKSFHIRSPYRFTSKLNLENVAKQPDILDDQGRPASSIDMDSRLSENYARLVGRAISAFWQGSKTGDQVRHELVGRINDALRDVLDIRITNLGDVTQGKGQLYFEKGETVDFPYDNLSSGEKEAIDIIVDLIVRAPEYDDTVYCIDEPELHLNTAIQRKLLVEIEQIIPPNCQLWIATHSVGFLRALQNDLADRSAVLDFSEKDYFRGSHTIRPLETTRQNWQRIFATALDDLIGLVAPARIVYCEGRPDPSPSGDEQGLDAHVYNEIFARTRPDTLFISSGGGGELPRNSSLAIKVLSKAFLDVDLLLLKDRDAKTDAERSAWLSGAAHHRMLTRRELENYLLDFEVLEAHCRANGRALARTDYDAIVKDLATDDLKAGSTTDRLKALCGEGKKTHHEFKLGLAPALRDTPVAISHLEADIFGAAAATTDSTALTATTTTPGGPP